MSAGALRYPPVERDDTRETHHGTKILDPYRYLEDPADPRTQAFVQAQNALSEPYLAALPARDWFAEHVHRVLSAPRTGTPWGAWGRYFAMVNPGDRDQDQLITAPSWAELLSAPRILLDPAEFAADGTVALAAAEVSPDGRWLAYALAEAGSDWWTIRVRSVDSGQDAPDRLPWCKWVAPEWMPDSGGFLYWRYPEPAGGEYTEAMAAGALRLHPMGGDPAQDAQIWARPDDASWLCYPQVAADGSAVVLTSAPGTDSRTLLHALRLGQNTVGAIVPQGNPVAIVAELADANHFIESWAGMLLVRTERGAERGRVVAVALDRPGDWTGVIAEHATDVLAFATVTSAGCAVVYSADAAHRLELRDLASGDLRSVALPERISVLALHGHPASAELFLGLTGFTRRPTPYRLDAGEPNPVPRPLDPSIPDGATADPAAITTERRRATAADGTSVPMTLVRRADRAAGPGPTLLYGYGGFDIPVLPAFSALFDGWVAAGGVLAVANLRGGGEFGSGWHLAGMLHAKQNVFDDAIACAEALIEQGVTTPGQLAVHGRSNGGLLVGALMTQRPELFAAALPSVGVLDMLRFHLFTIGYAWMAEYGSPDVEADFASLLRYSPLHNIRAGVAYPPTLICTGDHDDRVVPAHSLKFGAELQYRHPAGAPVLLRIDTRAGHGAGKPIAALAAEYADLLAFAAKHTGLRPA